MSKTRGVIESSLGSIFWGLSATASSALFTLFSVPYLVLLLFRSTVSAAIMLIIMRPRLEIRELKIIIPYGVIGLLGSQLTYLATIFYTNATTATIIQFFFLPMVIVYDIIRKNRSPSVILFTAMVTSIVGLLLLTLNIGLGKDILSISLLGLVFGLLSAVTAAASVVLSRSLVQSIGLASTVTYGFAFGALGSIAIGIVPTVSFLSTVNMNTFPLMFSLILFVALVGTLAAYTLFIASMKYIDATQASFLASFEPIAAAATSYIFLSSILTPLQYLGGAMMVLSASIAQRKERKHNGGGGEKDQL